VVELGVFGLWMAVVADALALRGGGRWLRWTGVVGRVVAALALALALLRRGIEGSRWPWATPYEFALVAVLSSVGTYLWWERWGSVGPIGAFALSPALALACWAQFLLPPSAGRPQPLPPALRSVWFPLHVLPAAVAYGAFALAGGLGALRVSWPRLRGQAPAPEQVEALIVRGIAFGYPWLSLSLLFGMVWAQEAWGDYWSWDIKEVWTLALWAFYTLVLHRRLRRGWEGTRLGWLALAGLGLVGITFLGLGWLARQMGQQSLHVF
jgi:ABC-type transport system involved in cytochrome c biogenesis permease subunit